MLRADDPASAAPERRARYTLPGGRPAFSPGWDAEIDVTDADNEADDTRGDGVAFSLTVDGEALVAAAPVLLAAAVGDYATLRLPVATPIDPRHAAIACVLASADKENIGAAATSTTGGAAKGALDATTTQASATLAAARTAPPTLLSAWTNAAGCASNGQRRSLAFDVPGFHICFDAEGAPAAWQAAEEDEASTARGVALVAVRVRRDGLSEC